ncbi:MAG TPA: AAA family ATPase [Burkholderiales bacterium]|nr:AAA family ATPase [Burkholderiales bacterium]
MTDQAEGLRRLLGRDFVRIVTLTSSRDGVGKTTATLNLATALANAGKSVMILDENPGKSNLADQLHRDSAGDILDVARHGKPLEEVMLTGPERIVILQASRGVQELADLSEPEQQRLIDCMRNIAKPADVVLVDTAAGSPGHLLSLTLDSQEIVVVLSPEGSAVTDAYALIKMMNLQYGKRHFRILVNKVKSGEEGRAVFESMSAVARRFLAVTLDFMGHVPFDGSLLQASNLGRPVVEAFPLAEASSSFRHIADAVIRWPCSQQMNMGDFLNRLIQSSRLSAARA